MTYGLVLIVRDVVCFNPKLSVVEEWLGHLHAHHWPQPGIQQVQALAGILRSVLCCHINETHAPIANPPNTTQLEGQAIPPSYIQVPAVVREWGER